MGIRIDGASDQISAADGSLTIEGQSINSTGIGTFSGGVKVGTAATIHSTGQFNIGVAATIFANGNATFAGILTAASYSGIDLGAVTGATGDFSIADKIVHTGDTNTTIRFPAADTFTIETAGTERFRIPSWGGVGINTTLIHSSRFLNIAAPTQDYGDPTTNFTNSGGVMFQPTSTLPEEGRNYPGIFWSGNTAALGRMRAGIIGVSANNNDATNIAFLTRHAADGTGMYPTDEKMRLTTEGRLGIGTTSPGATRLHCWDGDSGGSTASGSVVTIEKNATATLQFLSPNNAYNAIRFGDNNDNGAGWIQYNHSDNSMQFGSNGSEEMRMLSGGGITFNGDTASANALDDYEEGSWTPVIATGGGTVTNHWYTKVGNIVFVTGNLSAWGDTTSSTAITVTGFPFTCSATSYGHCVFCKHSDAHKNPWIEINSTTGTFLKSSTSTGSCDYMYHSGIVQSSGSASFCVWYKVS